MSSSIQISTSSTTTCTFTSVPLVIAENAASTPPSLANAPDATANTELSKLQINGRKVLCILSNGNLVAEATKAELVGKATVLNEKNTIKELNARLISACQRITQDYRTHQPLLEIISAITTTIRNDLYLIGRFLGDDEDKVLYPDFVLENDRRVDISPTSGQRQQLQSAFMCLQTMLFRVVAEHSLAQDLSTDCTSQFVKHEDVGFVQDLLFSYVINWGPLRREKSTIQCPDLWIRLNESVAVLQLSLARWSLACTKNYNDEVEHDEDAIDHEHGQHALDQLRNANRIARSDVWWLRNRTGSKMVDDKDFFGNNVFWPLCEVLYNAITSYLDGQKSDSTYEVVIKRLWSDCRSDAPVFRSFQAHDPTIQYFLDPLLREHFPDDRANLYNKSKQHVAKHQVGHFSVTRAQLWDMRLFTLL